MLEMMTSPRQGLKNSWKMFFVGLIYASLSILLVHWFFSSDAALSEASGMIVIAFCIMFTLPYMYFLIKQEEEEDEEIEGFFRVWKFKRFEFWRIINQNENAIMNPKNNHI